MVLAFGRQPANAAARDRVEHRKIELGLVRVEVDEKVVDLVQHLPRPRVLPVDLVDHDDRRQSQFQRLLQHEARLRQRPFAGVDQQQHAVHHLQRALHLAPEVGMSGRIDDVDLVPAKPHRCVLGQNRDPLLALQVARVHHPLDDLLVLAEDAGLPQHCVDQRRLAVVDVGDDRDVADAFSDGLTLDGRDLGCAHNAPSRKPSEVPGFVYGFGERTWSGKRESDRNPLPGPRRVQKPLTGNRCSVLLTAHGDRWRSESDRYGWSLGTRTPGLVNCVV